MPEAKRDSPQVAGIGRRICGAGRPSVGLDPIQEFQRAGRTSLVRDASEQQIEEAMIIETRNLKKFHRTEMMETTAVDDLDFTLDEGEFVSVMGPSGCGTSTLLHIPA
jgi:ABC-type glutathione transport system ATPase component